MASSKKRQRPPNKNGTTRNKRQKRASNDTGSTGDSGVRSAEAKTVRVEELAWKEVAMPDRLEDVEGFFGLEEIEGVDVIQEGGAKLFKVRRGSLHSRNSMLNGLVLRFTMRRL